MEAHRLDRGGGTSLRDPGPRPRPFRAGWPSLGAVSSGVALTAAEKAKARKRIAQQSKGDLDMEHRMLDVLDLL
jgi:hypothetical protein